METEIISIFCILDDYVEASNFKWRKGAKLSLSELALFAIVAAKYFGGNLTLAHQFFSFSSFFCSLPARSRINKRLLKIEDSFWIGLLEKLTSLEQEARINTLLVDSFPVFACTTNRSSQCKIYQGEKWIGYSSSKRTFFYGIKVHMITTSSGRPVSFCFLPASVSDLKGLKALLPKVRQGSLIMGDKAYWSSQLFEELAEKEIFLAALKKKNSKTPYTKEFTQWIKSTRCRIETTFSQIIKNMHRRIYAKTRKGFEVRITLFILTFALSHS